MMSKGSGRRKENSKLIEENWDRIFKTKSGEINGNKPNTTNSKEAERKRRLSTDTDSGKMERFQQNKN